MSILTQCEITYHVEKEMKHVGYLIQTLLDRPDSIHSLDHFVEDHKTLLGRIEAKKQTVKEMIHIEDLELHEKRLLQLQNKVLPQIKLILSKQSDFSLNESGLLSEKLEADIAVRASPIEKLTLCDITYLKTNLLENMSWTLIMREDKLDCLAKLIKGIEEKTKVRQDKDGFDDLVIMWKSMKRIYGFLHMYLEKGKTPANQSGKHGKRNSTRCKRNSKRCKRNMK